MLRGLGQALGLNPGNGVGAAIGVEAEGQAVVEQGWGQGQHSS